MTRRVIVTTGAGGALGGALSAHFAGEPGTDPVLSDVSAHAAPCCSTKAAVIQLATVAAVEHARGGIRVNCVCPGTFRSAIHENLPEEAIDAIAARHPLGLGSAGDLVGAYAYLAGEASRWTTGSAIVVEGGYSAP